MRRRKLWSTVPLQVPQVVSAIGFWASSHANYFLDILYSWQGLWRRGEEGVGGQKRQTSIVLELPMCVVNCSRESLWVTWLVTEPLV